MTDKIRSLVEKYQQKFGAASLEGLLRSRIDNPECVLTIICDDSIHSIPNEIIVGDRHVFSSGSFDISSSAAVEAHVVQCIHRLHEKLIQKEWKRIRLIYSGHAILAATAKMIVYRVTHIETDDIIYFGSTGYMDLSLKVRGILATASE